MPLHKVVWAEGMFMHPQHLQQQDKCHEYHSVAATQQLSTHAWGFSELKLDANLLRQGRVSIERARGILPDGTVFDIPQVNPHPPLIEIPENTRNVQVYLALPLHKPGGLNYSADAAGLQRYKIESLAVVDETTAEAGVNDIEVAVPNIRLMLESQELAGYSLIPAIKIIERKEDGSLLVEDNFIPTVLDINVADRLRGWVTELSGLLQHRTEALAARVSDGGRLGTAEVVDFLFLSIVNRYTPLLTHIEKQSGVHPQAFYMLLLQMAGELATFSYKTRRPPAFGSYLHDRLQESFAPVITSLRFSLSMVMEQTAVELPLVLRQFGIRVSTINDRNLLQNAKFVLAAKASIPTEKLRVQFPGVCKLGPVEDIRQLVNYQIQGIKLTPLPVAPRQIPYHSGFTYFELEKTGDYWVKLATSGGFALHAGDGFPGLELEFWAIRE